MNMKNTDEMEKSWQPNLVEPTIYPHWEAQNYFAPQGSGNPFCIMLPPPNVTGSLHMGHGFGFSLIDILIRYHRMLGDSTLWQPGTDHAGISTQLMVERQLAQAGQTRHDLGRDKFLEKVWQWKETSGNRITEQLRRLGASADWSREHFTLDEDLSRAVREVFVTLYNEGLIYRGTRLVNWDPQFLTAISDLEVVSNEEDTHLWHLHYPLVEGVGEIIVATTRPETLLGDVAVAVHPEDPRYAHLIGKQVQLPLTGRTIPVIADDYVDPAFGSGCVKITPAHDFNDYAIGQRHQLTPINIFTPDAKINENGAAAYRGLDRFVARKKILADLDAQGLLLRTEKYRTKIPRGEKSDVIIEPRLTQQWFMKMQPLAEPAIQAVESGKIKFIPENWSKTYFQWLNNIEDWCISRQLWWGHRIPVWYDDAGKEYVGHDEADVRQRYQLSAEHTLRQDDDVLDTWFSSALWPFSSLGWPEKTPELTAFYPTQVLATGFDIIFFWVARMIMLGLKFMGDVPFREVYITGLIRDAEGQKMSKTKGNVLDPLDLIDGIDLDTLVKKRIAGLMQPEKAAKIEKATRKEFPQGIDASGTDALRFTFCALASQNREIRFDNARLSGYRNFCNKLWNAARYVLMNTADQPLDANAPRELSLADRWILSRMQVAIRDAHTHLQSYRFDLLAQSLYEFCWNAFCDWYLELSKPVLTSPDSTAAQLAGTRHTLISVLETLLRLLHPIMPFITENIWQRVAPLAGIQADTLMLQAYPQVKDELIDAEADAHITWLQRVVGALRTLRSEMNIAPGKQLSILLRQGTPQDRTYFMTHEAFIRSLAKISSVTWLAPDEAAPESAIALAGTLEMLVPMVDFIDREAEIERLTREINKLTVDIAKMHTRLANPDFVARAPEAVVNKEKQLLADNEARCARLQVQLAKVNPAS